MKILNKKKFFWDSHFTLGPNPIQDKISAPRATITPYLLPSLFPVI